MKRFSIYKYLLAIIIPLALFSTKGYADTFTDNFDTGINSFYWTSSATGNSSVVWDSGTVVMTQGSSGSASLVFNYPTAVTGDFEIDVDYTLVNWTTNNGERLGITNNYGAVERISDSGYFGGHSGELYLTHLGSTIISTNTEDQSGTLRFARTGTILTGYYWNGSSWTALGSITATTGLNSLAISIWPLKITDGVQVAFDNFYLKSDTQIPSQDVPEPATMLLLGFGLVGLAGIGRKMQY